MVLNVFQALFYTVSFLESKDLCICHFISRKDRCKKQTKYLFLTESKNFDTEHSLLRKKKKNIKTSMARGLLQFIYEYLCKLYCKYMMENCFLSYLIIFLHTVNQYIHTRNEK